MGKTASVYLIWTYLADAEHGLDLHLCSNQRTMFTPRAVQHLKGSFGPLVVAFFQFCHKVIPREVALPS